MIVVIVGGALPLTPIGQARQQPDGATVRTQGVITWAADGFFC